MKDLYNNNKEFKAYVDYYCTMYGIPKELAFNQMIVKMTARQYMEQEELESIINQKVT